MPKNVRGRVYECPKCDWRGEKTWALEHYAKTHCAIDEAPHSCTLCKFKAGNFQTLMKHTKQQKHLRKLAKQQKDPTEVLLHNGTEGHILRKIRTLDAEASAKYWQQKKEATKTTKTKPPKEAPDVATQQRSVPTGEVNPSQATQEQSGEVNHHPSTSDSVKSTAAKDTQQPPEVGSQAASSSSSSSSSESENQATPSNRSMVADLFGNISDISTDSPKRPIKRKRENSDLSPNKKTRSSIPSEAAFQPDYQEMAAGAQEKETSHQPEVDFTPSPIAAGLLSVTHQLIMQNKNLINFQDHFDRVIDKLDVVLQSPKTTPMSQDIKGLFKMYNENMVAQHREMVTLHKSIDQLTSAVRSFTSGIQTSLNGIATSLHVFNSMVQSSVGDRQEAPVREKRWEDVQKRTNQHLENRRNSYPYHHSPNDHHSFSSHADRYHHEPPRRTEAKQPASRSSTSTSRHALQTTARCSVSISREIKQKYRKRFVYQNCFKGLRK